MASRESSAQQSDGTRRGRYPDSHQVFVGNLRHDIPDADIKAFFEKYGRVVDLRLGKKGSAHVPNFGFVVFEDEKSVQKVLSEKPLMLQECRLNVEAKMRRA